MDGKKVMKLVFDMPEYADIPNGPYPWEVDNVVSYIFLPIVLKDGKFEAPYCMGISNCDPDPKEEYVQNKMEEYHKGIRDDIYKFLDSVNAKV